MLIGEYRGLKRFNQRGSWFEPAKLYHYIGHAVYPWMASPDNRRPGAVNRPPDRLQQPTHLDGAQHECADLRVQDWDHPLPVVLGSGQHRSSVRVDPHSDDEDTGGHPGGAGDAPADSSHWQLCRDHVRITLYGANNDAAMSFLDAVNQYSLDHDVIGMMEIGAMRDAKRTQSEFGTIAQKKTIEPTSSYYQAQARNIGQQLDPLGDTDVQHLSEFLEVHHVLVNRDSYRSHCAVTSNAMITAGPETTVTPMTSESTCQAAAAYIVADAVGAYRIFAHCVAQ
jgi:hypothetical protein